MLRDMFSDVRQPSIVVGSKKRYTVAMSIAVHTAIVAAAMIIPLVATDVLPTPPIVTVFLSAPVPPPPPPPPVTNVSTATHDEGAPAVPMQAPSGISPEIVHEAATALPGDAIAVSGVEEGVLGIRPQALPPPPPAPATPSQEPVRPGGTIKAPTKVRDVTPMYPTLAQSARVQGVVIIEATIGADGSVQAAKVLRSIPLLDQAALDAVRQWQFTPTLLNGVAVPVIMTVTVNFTLR